MREVMWEKYQHLFSAAEIRRQLSTQASTAESSGMEIRRNRIGPPWDVSSSWSRKSCHETRTNKVVGMECSFVGRLLAYVAGTRFCHLNLAWWQYICNLSTWRAKAIRPEGQCLAGLHSQFQPGLQKTLSPSFNKWKNIYSVQQMDKSL